MSDHLIASTARSHPMRAAMPWLVGAGVYAFLLALGPQLLNDPDSYSHIAVGRWIIAHGAVPTSDAFSLSMRGNHWISFEWLAQVLYAAVFSFAGWNGVVGLSAAAVALAMMLLVRALLDHLTPKLALLMLCVAIVLLAPHVLARPHVLAFPLMVTWTAALVRCMDRQEPPPYWAVPLLVLWANLHGSVIVGIGLIGPVVLEQLIDRKRSEWSGVIRRWLPFSAVSIAAACVTPYGAGSLLIPVTTLGMGDALNYIAEWRPQNFGTIAPFELLLLGGIFALSRGLKLPVVRALVVLGLLHLALSQVRHADLLAMLAPLYLAAPLARQLHQNSENEPVAPAWTSVAAIGLMISATLLMPLRDLQPSIRNTPKAAIATAGLTSSDRILNDYSFGGYLDYAGIPSFVDGRGELHGGPFIARYNRAISLADLGDFLKLLSEYKFNATLLEPHTPAVALLDRLPEWKRVYGDDVAVVHKRVDALKD